MDPFSMAWETRRNLLPPAAHPKVCAAAFCNSNSVRNQKFLQNKLKHSLWGHLLAVGNQYLLAFTDSKEGKLAQVFD
jgi:hypothetical protein